MQPVSRHVQSHSCVTVLTTTPRSPDAYGKAKNMPDYAVPEHEAALTPWFPVSHSLLSASALLAFVQSTYQLPSLQQCTLLSSGLNDTYLITTAPEGRTRVILRIYRAEWRSEADIRYELDALFHLRHKHVPISYPLTAADGTILQTLHAPEGMLHAVLFTYAPGQPMAGLGRSTCHLFRRALAELHAALDDFSSSYRCFQLDLEHLIARPLHLIQPLLQHRRNSNCHRVPRR